MFSPTRKTKYAERGEHFFGQHGGEVELPWRKWIRENLPRGPEGFCFEDIDGVAVVFDPQRHINQKFMLLEFKYWNVKLDRSQIEVLRMLDGLLSAGDPYHHLYKGVYVVEWHREDEFARVNGDKLLPFHQLSKFFLFEMELPSYFER